MHTLKPKPCTVLQPNKRNHTPEILKPSRNALRVDVSFREAHEGDENEIT